MSTKALNTLSVEWRTKAIDLREEAGRIRRTIKEATDAEERCNVRAEIYDKCADELDAALRASDPPTVYSPVDPNPVHQHGWFSGVQTECPLCHLRASEAPYVVGDNGSPADFQLPYQVRAGDPVVERCAQCGEPFDHPNHDQRVPVSVVPTMPHPFTVAADPVTGPPCPAERHSDGARCTSYAGHLGTHSYPPVRETAQGWQPSMADAAEMLWVVLANVSGGNWSLQSPEWQEAAARWRDNYFIAAGHISQPKPLPRACGASEGQMMDWIAMRIERWAFRLHRRLECHLWQRDYMLNEQRRWTKQPQRETK